jgi:hypothetical protein
MKRLALALASTFFAAPAFAGVYVNVENNGSYDGVDYTGSTTDLHIGYEGGADGFGYYIQGGPAIVATDGADDTDTQVSGKVGANVAATEKLGFYGELAVQTNDGDADNSWSTKVGTKYNF